MPEVDVQELDLLDEHEDGSAGRSNLVSGVLRQPVSPRPEHLELLFVEPRTHPEPRVDPLVSAVTLRMGIPPFVPQGYPQLSLRAA